MRKLHRNGVECIHGKFLHETCVTCSVNSRHEHCTINHIHNRIDQDTGLKVELFESIDEPMPYRVRLVDVETNEVGPQIRMYDTLSDAARFYEKHTPTW